MTDVSVFRHFLILLLLALWLPATQHCGLEAAGVLAEISDAATSEGCCSSQPGPACSHDNCAVVEAELSKTSNDELQVSPPAAQWIWLFAVLAPPPGLVEAEPCVCLADTGQPPAWLTCWQFDRRLVRLSRAPSSLLS